MLMNEDLTNGEPTIVDSHGIKSASLVTLTFEPQPVEVFKVPFNTNRTEAEVC